MTDLDFHLVESNGHRWLITTPTSAVRIGRSDGSWRCENCGVSVHPSEPAVPCPGPTIPPTD